jgi:phosphoribosylanthranilate isomerase
MSSEISSLHKLQLKVCGLTKIEQIHELISMNTDFLGFIFYEKSSRFVLNHLSLEEISKINHSGKVGVFVNEKAETIIETATKANLNFIQLHGDEDKDFIKSLREKLNSDIKIIKAFRVGNQIENLQSKIDDLQSEADYFLFDTDSKSFGGTGKQFKWHILNTLEIPIPYFLSGGISEENVENIEILIQKPFALDINSKFETEPGNKNLEKIKTFKNMMSPKGTI